MRKAFIALFMSVLAAVGVNANMAAAFAETSCTVNNDLQYCNTTSSAVSMGSASTSVVSVASSDAKGMTNLEFETTRGYTTSAGCYKAASFTKVPRGYHCWIATTKGYKFQNSGLSRNKVRHYFDDYIGSKYSPVGTRFYYDTAHKAWRKQNCGNYVKFSGSAGLPVSKVALVKSFSNVTVTVKATQTATQDVYATASCATSNSSAYASAYGHGSATGTATASASAISQTQATSSATSKAKSSAVADANAKVYAAAQVAMYSVAWVSCSSTPPPPQYNAPSVSAQAEACVAQGGTTGVVDGTVTNPNGIADTASVTLNGVTKTVSVAANSSAAFQFTGLAVGSYTGSATLQTAGQSTNFTVAVQQCSTPQQTPPTVVNMTQLNDVDAGATSPNFCATVNVPGSDQGTLTFSAQYGTFQITTFAVNGQVQKCTTYVAPTEVPSGGRDSVTVFVRDNSTGLSAQQSESFPINTPPAPPA